MLGIAEKFHDALLNFIRNGIGKEKVEKISWQITSKMNSKFDELRANEEVHVSYVLKKTLDNGVACFSFFHVFLCEFQIDKYPALYNRLQFLWAKLYIAETIEYIFGRLRLTIKIC